MKIYSDILTEESLHNACLDIAMRVDVLPIRRSRVRRHGYHVSSFGTGGGRRFKNSGKAGAQNEPAATWDTHGQWMARIFSWDPEAVIVAAVRYEGKEDFHAKTKGKYLGA